MSYEQDVPSVGWCAGFFDGEGSVALGRRRGVAANLAISLVNTDRAAMLAFASRVGGKVFHARAKRPNERDTWRWQLNGVAAVRVLKVLLPELRIKRERADLALCYWQETGHVRLYEGNQKSASIKARAEDHRAARDWYKRRFMDLNRRGRT